MRLSRLIVMPALLFASPAFAASITIDAYTERAGIVPCLIVTQPGDTFRARLDLDDRTSPVMQARVDSRGQALAWGLAFGGAPLEEVSATCGGVDTLLYPDVGRVVLPADCADAVSLEIVYGDGSLVELTLDAQGRARNGFVDPASIVGFNPQPDIPGLPQHVVLEFDFGTEVRGGTLDVLDGIIHPPEPGAPEALVWY